MRSTLIVLLAFLCIAANAKNPSTPVWPKGFSASVLVVNVSNPDYTYFYRWFHDLKLNKARLDGFIGGTPNVPPVFTKIIVDEEAKEEYVVLYPRDQVSCYSREINHPMLNPDFSDFQYSGLSIINYVTVNQWVVYNSTDHNLFVYYEDAETREPVRFSYVNSKGQEEDWTIFEFDAGDQDPALFELEGPIKGICNPIDSDAFNKMMKQ